MRSAEPRTIREMSKILRGDAGRVDVADAGHQLGDRVRFDLAEQGRQHARADRTAHRCPHHRRELHAQVALDAERPGDELLVGLGSRCRAGCRGAPWPPASAARLPARSRWWMTHAIVATSFLVLHSSMCQSASMYGGIVLAGAVEERPVDRFPPGTGADAEQPRLGERVVEVAAEQAERSRADRRTRCGRRRPSARTRRRNPAPGPGSQQKLQASGLTGSASTSPALPRV